MENKNKEKSIPKVCFFGIYDSTYARNRVLISGFQKNGFEVVHCRVDPRKHKGVSKFIFLIREYLRVREKFNFVIVAFPGHTVVWLARILFGKHIIFDAFVSLYNSNVEDRKLYTGASFRGIWNWFLDWHSMHIASVILFDTNTQIDYVSKKFGIAQGKFRRVLVGTTEDIFYPAKEKKENDKFIVHFHGSLIPLQGLPYIVGAARILAQEEKILFRIIGGGQEYENTKNLINEFGLKNIELLKPMPLLEIGEYLRQSDISLGIFGDTNKTELVIPNKVYEAIACGVPVVTANTKAAREVFSDKKNVFFCERGSAESIAKAVLSLYNDRNLCDLIGKGGYDIFKQHATPAHLVSGLLKTLL